MPNSVYSGPTILALVSGPYFQCLNLKDGALGPWLGEVWNSLVCLVVSCLQTAFVYVYQMPGVELHPVVQY